MKKAMQPGKSCHLPEAEPRQEPWSDCPLAHAIPSHYTPLRALFSIPISDHLGDLCPYLALWMHKPPYGEPPSASQSGPNLLR